MSNPLQQALEDWHRAGVTELPPVEQPLDFTSLAASTENESLLGPAPSTADEQNDDRTNRTAAVDPEPSTDVAPTPSVSHSAAPADQLEALRQRVAACTKCQELAQSRTQTVFGVGAANADIMFVGEAPGADEDRVGEPFVGRAGQLLDRIINASGWKREELYICNILRCRPPGNRNPTPDEAANCREYLDGQIAAVNPTWIICWGSVAAKNLLSVDRPIGRMRKQLFDHGTAKVLCTYHPSYLLRNPAAKKDVWEDLQFLFREMGHVPPSLQK